MTVIGITCRRQGGDIALSRRYVEALTPYDVTPLLLWGEEALTALPLLDGVLLTGGGDVAVTRSGAEYARGLDLVRDRLEIPLVCRARERGVPVLGICRGMQVINAALGGTLQDGVTGHEEHWHFISVAPHTRLRAVLGQKSYVNSAHVQAVDRLAPGLIAAAVAPDGVVEAIEGEGVWGLQWHPERMPCSRGIFEAWIVNVILAKSRRQEYDIK